MDSTMDSSVEQTMKDGEDSNMESYSEHVMTFVAWYETGPQTMHSETISLSGKDENKSDLEKQRSFKADGEASNNENFLQRYGWIGSMIKIDLSSGHILLDFEIQPPRPRGADIRRQFEIQRLTEVDTLLDFKIQPPRPKGVTLDIQLLYTLLRTVQKSSAYDQQSVMMEIKYREQKKKKGKANGKTSKQKYVTMVFESEKRLSDDRLLKLRNENDIRIMKIQEKFERIIAQLDAKIQHGKRKRQHAPI